MGIILILVVGVAAAAFVVLRKPPSLPGSDDDSVCVGCGSKALEVLAPGAYRCLSCKYEGGSGMAAWQRGLEQREASLYEPDERKRRAHALRAEAATMLRSALADLHGAMAAGQDAFARPTLLGPRHDVLLNTADNDTAERFAMDVVGSLCEARRLLERASDFDPLPALPPPLPELIPDVAYSLAQLAAQGRELQTWMKLHAPGEAS